MYLKDISNESEAIEQVVRLSENECIVVTDFESASDVLHKRPFIALIAEPNFPHLNLILFTLSAFNSNIPIIVYGDTEINFETKPNKIWNRKTTQAEAVQILQRLRISNQFPETEFFERF